MRLLHGDGTGGADDMRSGRRGEDAAASHLLSEGYKLLERNYRIRQGEIDLVAFRDGTLVFVEVRSRTLPNPLDPALTVTRRKQLCVLKAAQHYLTHHRPRNENVTIRFDVMTVSFGPPGSEPQIKHIENAFQRSAKSFT